MSKMMSFRTKRGIFGFLILMLFLTSCGRVVSLFIKPIEKTSPQADQQSITPPVPPSDSSIPDATIKNATEVKLRIINYPREYGYYGKDYWGPSLLTDGIITDHAYSSASGEKFPMRFVFELAAGQSKLTQIGISNYCQGWDNSHTKAVEIYVSDDIDPNKTEAYQKLQTVILVHQKEIQNFNIEPTYARYVALNITENYGGSWAILNEVKAWGSN